MRKPQYGHFAPSDHSAFFRFIGSKAFCLAKFFFLTKSDLSHPNK